MDAAGARGRRACARSPCTTRASTSGWPRRRPAPSRSPCTARRDRPGCTVTFGPSARGTVELAAALSGRHRPPGAVAHRPRHRARSPSHRGPALRRPLDVPRPGVPGRHRADGHRATSTSAACSPPRPRPGALLDNVGPAARLLDHGDPHRPAPSSSRSACAGCGSTARRRAPGTAAGVPGPDHVASPTPSWRPTSSCDPRRSGVGGAGRLAGPAVRQRPADPAGGALPRAQHAVARPSRGAGALVYERWPDLASRELIMRNYLGAAERADYERRAAARPPAVAAGPDRGQGRGAAAGCGSTARGRSSRPRSGCATTSRAARRDRRSTAGPCPPLDVSLAHRGRGRGRDRAPATRQRHRGPGIDIEEVVDARRGHWRPPSAPSERAPAHRLPRRRRPRPCGSPASGPPRRRSPRRRAPGSAAATAVRGPRSAPSRRPLRLGRRTRRTGCTARTVANPPALPGGSYVVAWTTARATTTDEERTSGDTHPRTQPPRHRRTRRPSSRTSPAMIARVLEDETASTTPRSAWTPGSTEDLEMESIDLVTLAGHAGGPVRRPGQLRRVRGRPGTRRDHRADRRPARRVRRARASGAEPMARRADHGDGLGARHGIAGSTSGCTYSGWPRAAAARPPPPSCWSTACSPTAWPATTSPSPRPSPPPASTS